jgi:hypothetical protein
VRCCSPAVAAFASGVLLTASHVSHAQDSTASASASQAARFSRSRVAADSLLPANTRLLQVLRVDLASPRGATQVLVPAALLQLANAPDQWGRTVAGYGQRAGTLLAVRTTRDLLLVGSSALLGHDWRYQRCDCSGAARRFGQATSGMFLFADAEGQRRFDPAHVVTAIGTGYVAASLYPRVRPGNEMRVAFIAQQLGLSLVGNIAQEFAPDVGRWVKRSVFRRN